MDRMKDIEDIIRNDILQKERKVKDTTVNVHIIGDRDQDDFITEILAGQHKYSRFPQLKQSSYLFHQCIRGGPPSKKSSKRIGCKAYISFKKMSHPMGGNVVVVTEKNIHTGHDPDSTEDHDIQASQVKRKRIQSCTSVSELIEKGWMEKVVHKGNGVFRVPMEVNEDKSYTVFLPELSCSCRAGKKQLLCKHLELLMKMQEESRVENLNELMVEEARSMFKEQPSRYSVISRETGEIKIFIMAHKISVHCTLSTRNCTCPAFSFTGICPHLHLASILLPEFNMDSTIAEEITYSDTVTEEIVFNTSQHSASCISKLRDVIHYLETATPSQEITELIDDLHDKVKDNFVYVVSVTTE